MSSNRNGGTVWGWWDRFKGRRGNGLIAKGGNGLGERGWGWREWVGGWGMGMVDGGGSGLDTRIEK